MSVKTKLNLNMCRIVSNRNRQSIITLIYPVAFSEYSNLILILSVRADYYSDITSMYYNIISRETLIILY